MLLRVLLNSLERFACHSSFHNLVSDHHQHFVIHDLHLLTGINMSTAPPVFNRKARKPWQGTKPSKRVITGRALQKARAKLFERDPLCAECKRQGRVTIATIRDHVVNLAAGGLDIEENTQGLCQACSDAKTAKEAQAGRGRAF